MTQPGRDFSLEKYKFGYQGSEKDDEITGIGQSHFTTFFREGDARLARWWSLDPKGNLTPWESPYASMANSPIQLKDEKGDFLGTIIGTTIGVVAGGIYAHKNNTSVWAGMVEGGASGFVAGAIVDLTAASGGTATALVLAGAAGSGLGSGIGDLAGKFVGNLESGKNVSQALSSTKLDKGTAVKIISGQITGTVAGAMGASVYKLLKPVEESTKQVLKTMSKNITETTKTLNSMGASQNVVSNAVEKVTTGMGKAGRNTNVAITNVEVATTTAIESASKPAGNAIETNMNAKSSSKPSSSSTKNEAY